LTVCLLHPPPLVEFFAAPGLRFFWAAAKHDRRLHVSPALRTIGIIREYGV